MLIKVHNIKFIEKAVTPFSLIADTGLKVHEDVWCLGGEINVW